MPNAHRKSPDPPATADLSAQSKDNGTLSTTPASGITQQRSYQRVRDALLSIGPFAAVLTAYGLIFDNIPDRWFTYLALKYIFSGVSALAIGLALRLAAEQLTASHRTKASEPVQRKDYPATDLRRAVTNTSSPYNVLAQTANAIDADLREGEHSGTATYGWSQYMGDTVPPSAIGSSYGLRTAMLLDIRSPRLNYGRIVASLIALQRPGGGWAASTQRGVARPEVTAWILPPAMRAGMDQQAAGELIEHLERMSTADTDPVAFNRTAIISILVSAFSDIAPKSARLPALARALASAAHRDRPQELAYWGEKLDDATNASSPHTARAAIALKKAARVLPGAAELNVTADAGISWLSQSTSQILDIDEQLRRPLSDGDVDALFIGHFSAAWIARALMYADDIEKVIPVLRTAMGAVLDRQDHGVWQWHDGSKPMWMTYQGANALRDYILRGIAWPP